MATTIGVSDMSCAGCERAVEDALRGVDGVTDAAADRAVGEVRVDGEPDVDALVRAVEDAGHRASA